MIGIQKVITLQSVKTKFDPDKVFFTSDQHFGHENIIKFTNRPFSDVGEMNRVLIENWNATVPEDGIVFNLGDVAFGPSFVWNHNLSQLHGKHYLIMGNHDFKNYRDSYSKYFEFVGLEMYIRIEDKSIYLNHHPLLCFGGAYRKEMNVWNLFGHVHSGPRNVSSKDSSRLSMLFPTQYDVGVDNNDFRPISYWEVKEKIAKQIEEAGIGT